MAVGLLGLDCFRGTRGESMEEEEEVDLNHDVTAIVRCHSRIVQGCFDGGQGLSNVHEQKAEQSSDRDVFKTW